MDEKIAALGFVSLLLGVFGTLGADIYFSHQYRMACMEKGGVVSHKSCVLPQVQQPKPVSLL